MVIDNANLGENFEIMGSLGFLLEGEGKERK